MLDIYSNHFFITSILSLILFFIFFKNKNPQRLYKLLTFLLVLNISTFNCYLIYSGNYDFKVHLPLHLCYLTEIGILLSIFFKTEYYYGWLLLNSLGGGLSGFLNSNLEADSLFIEYLHLYLSHFNLLLFSIFVYKSKFILTKNTLIKSTLFNAFIFLLIVIFNIFFSSNYWFTRFKPPGVNLTKILPGFPYYLLVLVIIGLISYYCTFKLFSKHRKIKADI